jgi:phosphate transport system ATP-binding protein
VAAGLKLNGIRDKKLIDEVVRESLEGAALWEEIKSELTKPGIGLSGDQQQRLCSTTYELMSPRAYWLSTWPFK